MWNEDKELLEAVDRLMAECQPHLGNLMTILGERKILDDPNMVSLYALGVFADEYSYLRSVGDYEKSDTPMLEIIAELIINSHLAVQKDAKLQHIAASVMVNKIDKAVDQNV